MVVWALFNLHALVFLLYLCAVEDVKATSAWKPKDINRVVPTLLNIAESRHCPADNLRNPLGTEGSQKKAQRAFEALNVPPPKCGQRRRSG